MSVKFEFKGQTDNKEIHGFYQNNRVDCFITTSASEGLPVSIMEAMSYGIPIIATNVGGINELIDGNGILLSDNPSVEEIGEAINGMLNMNPEQVAEMRRASFDNWKEKFDARNNASFFANFIAGRFGSCSNKLIITIDSVSADWCFIENEIIELAKHFRIILIETKANRDKGIIKNEQELVQKACKDIEFYQYFSDKKITDLLLSIKSYFYDNKTLKERRCIIRSREKVLQRFWESVKYYSSAEAFYQWLLSKEIIDDNCLFYSFWQQDVSLAMCLHKCDNKVITRTHGYDLYDSRYLKGKRQPFREYMDDVLDLIVFIANVGKKYYLERYQKIDSDKYFVSYLGSAREKEDLMLDYEQDNVFRVVSCSSLIGLKRVNLIADALKIVNDKLCTRNIEWIHFGGGELQKQLEIYTEQILS